MSALVLATITKSVASVGLQVFVWPSLAYLALTLVVMISVPRSAPRRRGALAAMLALGVTSMASSHNETLLMTMSLMPVTALLEGMWASIAMALLLVAATATVSAAWDDPPLDRVQWVASVIGGDLFLLGVSRQLVRERQAQVELRRQSLLAQELSAAAERNRISADLHDGLGHHLSAALIQLEAARALGASAPEKAEAFIDRARGLIQGAMGEVRLAISVSRPYTGRRSFLAALEELVQDSEDAGVPTRLEGMDEKTGLRLDRLPPTTQYALWRGVQEALTNVRRHARARGATVRVASSATDVTIVIRDDGRGFSQAVEGTGLRAMRERIESAGGRLGVESADGRGTALTLRVPT